MYSYHSATVESDSGKKLSDGIIISFAFDQMSIHLNNTDEIKINETLIINIFTKTNGCIIYKGIAKALYNNALTIDCVIFIEEKQRRKNHRMTVSIPLRVKRINRGNKNTFNLQKPILMKARDISINGILLESTLDIPDDIHFNIDLPLKNMTLNIVTDTVRKYVKDNKFYYGCTFTLQTEEELNFLRNFINNNYIYQVKNKNPKIKLYPTIRN
ncbi:MAG: PilZ domain-containing protein [Clostridium sp.]|uniref:PilZ domain-containing protein n=1 Tax=Clostridium sp. TaxID=1506 RepID=UPI00399196A1